MRLHGISRDVFDRSGKGLLEHPGSWSKQYGQRLEEAVRVLDDHLHTSAMLDSLQHCSTKNRFHWELFSVLNDFQVMAPRLLLALKDCDTGNSSRRSAASANLRKTLADFEKAWEDLSNVYGKTRFVSYPAGYVPDRYFHFASQREDLTWMIQVEELLFGMINRWLEDNQLP